jgi:NAD(P)-dependent dehydrogenase (short-subunit alcohol dehydrogenase family)
MRFQDQVVIVTGGSSGIGAETAQEFAAEGARVVITGRDRRRTEDMARRTRAVHVGLGDITDPRYCAQLVQEVVERCGRVDVLVNNAGTIVRQDTATTTDRQWLDLMAVNVNAVFFMSREALKAMRRQGGGAIVNVSSTCGLVGCKGLTAYCTSKGALIQMTQAMALDAAEDGVRVNAVCPGAADTPMLASGHARTPTRAQLEQVQVETVPMGRMGQPGEVARAILFLASREASYITGTHLSVDGGYTCQ